MKKDRVTCNELISELTARFDSLDDDCQYWIGLAGGPGSGKSTVTQRIQDVLGDRVAVIPMDGYHLYRSELDEMEDAEEAYERRGAPFTFNAGMLVDDLLLARETGSGVFPGFDHRMGDPEEGGVRLEGGKKIVIVEGNYLLLGDSPWNRLRSEVFDEGWFLYVPIEECKRRVLKRHVEVMKVPREVAMWRVLTNDGPNAELVTIESMVNASRVIVVS